jgi:hypothetical protein
VNSQSNLAPAELDAGSYVDKVVIYGNKDLYFHEIITPRTARAFAQGDLLIPVVLVIIIILLVHHHRHLLLGCSIGDISISQLPHQTVTRTLEFMEVMKSSLCCNAAVG